MTNSVIHRRRSLRVGLFAAVAAGVLAATSAAWACTAIMGQLTFTPTSGNPGTIIEASATGLKASAKYRLLMADAAQRASGGDCHTNPRTTIKKGIRTDGSGAFSGVSAKIPTAAAQGVAVICGLETYPVKNQTATTHESFTVL